MKKTPQGYRRMPDNERASTPNEGSTTPKPTGRHQSASDKDRVIKLLERDGELSVVELQRIIARQNVELERRTREIALLSEALLKAQTAAPSSDQALNVPQRSEVAGKSNKDTSAKNLLNIVVGRFGRRSKKFQREVAILRKSGLFDREWYLNAYPDVAESSIDPLIHYVRFGAMEGRNPSPDFDTNKYLASQPDLKLSGENPLVHYVVSAGGTRG